MVEQIAASKVHPKYLISNSTSHPWAFGAFAELIDNSYDAKAREAQIDKLILEGETCLSFQDDGSGMDKDKLYKMLSFGFCERVLSTAIGQYGNGFKSSSMRLGKDALVFTKKIDTAGVGFLSQTFNEAINADSVKVPMLHYTYSGPNYCKEGNDHEKNLAAILNHSPLTEEEMLIKQLRLLPKTGTRVIIFNLKRNDGNFELDFERDPEDIRSGEVFQLDISYVSKYRSSLREYCSILYLKPRMKIMLRGKYVKTKFVEKSLCHARNDTYSPKQEQRSTKITFGFVPVSEQSEDCGMMLYIENRLIKPYEPVSCQKQGKGIGAHVVGVTQARFLTPTQNKQDFNRDSMYHQAMLSYNLKLKKYWESYKDLSSSQPRNIPDSTWVQCEYKTCQKWRRLPQLTDQASLPAKWYCYMHPSNIDCFTPEENQEDEEIILRPPSRSQGKRKASANLSALLNGKRGKQNSIRDFMNSVSGEESNDYEETTSTSDSSSFLCAPNIPSTSSAGNSARRKRPAYSRSQSCKITPAKPSKTTSVSDDHGTTKPLATSVLGRNSYRKSSYRRSASAVTTTSTSMDLGADNTNTSHDISQLLGDNTNISHDISQLLGDNINTSHDISQTLGNNTENTNDIDQDLDDSFDNTNMSLDLSQLLSDNANTSLNSVQGTDVRFETSLNSLQGTDVRSETSLNSLQGTDVRSETSLNNEQEADLRSETSLNNVQGTVVNSEFSTETGHLTTEISLIKLKNKEIAELKVSLNELRQRFNALLENSRQLLKIIAPNVPLSDNVNIEELIIQMIQNAPDIIEEDTEQSNK